MDVIFNINVIKIDLFSDRVKLAKGLGKAGILLKA